MEQTIHVDQVIADAVSPVLTSGTYSSYASATVAPVQPPSVAPYYSAIQQAIQSIWEKEVYVPSMYSFTYHAAPGFSALAGPPKQDTPAHALLSERLTALGSTPQEARDSMLKLGIQAIPGNTQECAIARWLKQVHYPEAVCVSVGHGGISVSGGGEVVTVSTPPALRAFIRMFDGCQFPELMLPSVRPFLGELTFDAPISVPTELVDAVSGAPGAE